MVEASYARRIAPPARSVTHDTPHPPHPLTRLCRNPLRRRNQAASRRHHRSGHLARHRLHDDTEQGPKKPEDAAKVAGVRVVAAYPKGSPDIESSTERVPDYTEKMKELGVEIVDSIDELVKRVDCVLLETQRRPAASGAGHPRAKAGKPVFIDKPIAGSLADAIAHFRRRQEVQRAGLLLVVAPLRQDDAGSPRRLDRQGEVGAKPAARPRWRRRIPICSGTAFTACESLFTVMGTGCESVTRGDHARRQNRGHRHMGRRAHRHLSARTKATAAKPSARRAKPPSAATTATTAVVRDHQDSSAPAPCP